MKEVFTGGRGLAVFGEALDTKGLSGHIRAVASGAFHVCVLQEDGPPGFVFIGLPHLGLLFCQVESFGLWGFIKL